MLPLCGVVAQGIERPYFVPCLKQCPGLHGQSTQLVEGDQSRPQIARLSAL